MKLYKVTGGQKGWVKELFINSINKKDAIILFLNSTKEEKHENIQIEKITETISIINADEN